MRAVFSVIKAAGVLKQNNPEEIEDKDQGEKLLELLCVNDLGGVLSILLNKKFFFLPEKSKIF